MSTPHEAKAYWLHAVPSTAVLVLQRVKGAAAVLAAHVWPLSAASSASFLVSQISTLPLLEPTAMRSSLGLPRVSHAMHAAPALEAGPAPQTAHHQRLVPERLHNLKRADVNELERVVLGARQHHGIGCAEWVRQGGRASHWGGRQCA